MARGRPKGSKNEKKSITIQGSPTSIPELVQKYYASIKIFGKSYTGSGTSLKEAIASIKPDGIARGVTVLSIYRRDDVTQKDTI